MGGGELQVDSAVLILYPLDVTYLDPADPVREKAQVDMVVDLIPDDLVCTRVGEVSRRSRCSLKCFRFGKGPGANRFAVRPHQRCNHPPLIGVGEDAGRSASEGFHDAVALHLNGPVDQLPAAYQIMHGATLSVSATQEQERGVPSNVVNGQTIALMIVGFLIGMLAAGGIGVRVIEEVRAENDATSLPSENVSSPNGYFLDPNETLIASAAVVPTSVVASDTSVEIQYDILSLAPLAGFPPTGIPHLYPRSWRLTTESGTVEGGPDNINTGIALFELPADQIAKDVLSVDIVDPLVPYPLDAAFELSAEEPSAAVTASVRVELSSVTEQDDSTVVLLNLIADDPSDLAFIIEGVGPGWRSDPTEPGNPTVELIWVGGERPEVLALRAVGIQWIALEGVYPVSLKGQL